MTLLAGALALGLATALLLHELGHVVAALVLGGRVERVRWSGLGARVVAELPSRRAQALFLLAGAGANLVVAAAALALAFAARSSTMAGAMGLFAGMHLLHALFALLPVGESDGARLRALAKARQDGGPPEAERGER